MKFLKQTSIANYRKTNKPDVDPIFKIPLEVKDAVLDHDHSTGDVRSVIHRDANQFEGKISNIYTRYARSRTTVSLPDILRNLADYLEFHKANPGNLKHPGHIRVEVRRLCALPAEEQKVLLREFNLPDKTQAIRKKSFRKYIMKKHEHIKEVSHGFPHYT